MLAMIARREEENHSAFQAAEVLQLYPIEQKQRRGNRLYIVRLHCCGGVNIANVTIKKCRQSHVEITVRYMLYTRNVWKVNDTRQSFSSSHSHRLSGCRIDVSHCNMGVSCLPNRSISLHCIYFPNLQLVLAFGYLPGHKPNQTSKQHILF